MADPCLTSPASQKYGLLAFAILAQPVIGAESRHRERLTVHWAAEHIGDRSRLDTVMGRNWVKDFSADCGLSVDDPPADPLPCPGPPP